MKLCIAVWLDCGDDVNPDRFPLADEAREIETLTDTQRAECKRVAHAAVDLLAGETVLRKPLIEHLGALD